MAKCGYRIMYDEKPSYREGIQFYDIFLNQSFLEFIYDNYLFTVIPDEIHAHIYMQNTWVVYSVTGIKSMTEFHVIKHLVCRNVSCVLGYFLREMFLFIFLLQKC